MTKSQIIKKLSLDLYNFEFDSCLSFVFCYLRFPAIIYR